MKHLKLIIIFTLIFLINSCGYKKLNSVDLNNFKIDKLEINGEGKLTYKIRNNIMIFSSQNSKITYNVDIKLKSIKQTKIKNTAGKTTRYSIGLQADVLIINTSQKKEYKKTFNSVNDYDVSTNHSDTINNEKKANDNNLNYISNEIIKYLRLLNIQ